MKKILLSLFVALIATTAIQAQQISVVSPGGTTTLHRTLQEAIKEATSGSVIYLPGGGFNLPDSVKITKKLTIIGIGHKAKSDNVDGVTTISGHLWFNGGSSSSAVLGCYISGNVNIGDDGASVNDVLIRYCNLSSVQVRNKTCLGTMVNQNYIRSKSFFSGANATISNCIIFSISNLDNGLIKNNILTGSTGDGSIEGCNKTEIINNIMARASGVFLYSCSDSGISDNMALNSSDAEYNLGGKISWNDVFVNFNNGTVSPTSNFHFKDAYKQYETIVGIYAGTGFNDQQMAPVPYIVAKHVDEQTDSYGKLNVKIRVKANQ